MIIAADFTSPSHSVAFTMALRVRPCGRLESQGVAGAAVSFIPGI